MERIDGGAGSMTRTSVRAALSDADAPPVTADLSVADEPASVDEVTAVPVEDEAIVERRGGPRPGGRRARNAAIADTSSPTTATGAWVVLPTYDEIDNLGPIAAAILAAAPDATLLVVDDNSPDGTGGLADELAASDGRIRVRHRTAKEGLGRAYLDGFQVALADGAAIVCQMDADWSHDPSILPRLLGPIRAGEADLVIGSRYTKGGRVEDWGLGRRFVSRAGSLFAQVVLTLRPNDLTGGFKAWRASTLQAIPFDRIHAGGYVFQIETTYLASRGGARIREVPITFRDRRVGASKMSRRIVLEALVVVVRLRIEEILGAARRRLRGEAHSGRRG